MVAIKRSAVALRFTRAAMAWVLSRLGSVCLRRIWLPSMHGSPRSPNLNLRAPKPSAGWSRGGSRRRENERPRRPKSACRSNPARPSAAWWRSASRQEAAMENSEDPLAQFGLDAIDLRCTLKDIAAKRSWIINEAHVSKLIELDLVEMRDGDAAQARERLWRTSPGS